MYIPAHIVTPRERIALGSRRVTALRGLSQGLAAGLLALQQQILCEAESWMGTVEVPMGSNKGGRVDELLKLYFGSTTAQKWCVVYVWVVYDRAVRALGGVNKLPGASVVWGNAKATLDKSKSIFTVNTTPDVAALFYRTTTKPGDTASSGHFGIVISWDGTTLATIEGNQGDTSKVDHYTYSAAQIQSYGFQFIHAQRAPVTATSPVAPCKPVATPPTSGGIVPPPSGGATPGGTTPGGTVPVTSGGSSITSGGSSITTGTITTGTTAVTRRPIPCPPCVVKTITLPASGMIRHYSAVLENAVAADIHGASLGVSPSQRNGAATTPSGSPDADAYSGVGVFKDGNGNLIWISNEGFGQYAALRKYGLLGKSDRAGVPVEPYTFRFQDFEGDTGKDGNALALQGKVESPYCALQREPTPSERVKGTYSKQKMRVTLGGRTIEFCNPYQLLQEIEKIGTRLDRPILIVNYHKEPFTWTSALKLALKVLDVVVKYGSMFGLELSPLLPKIQGAVQQLVSSGGALSVASVANFATIAWQIAPDSIRQELNTAAAAVEAKAKGALGDVASILKMAQNNAVQLIAPLVDFASQGAGLATAIEGVILNSGLGPTSARATIQNILNVRMISRFQSQISSGQMVQNFIGSGSNMYEVPEINAMFLTGAAGQLLPLIPQAGEILGPIIQAGQTTLEYGTPEKYNNLVRGLALSAIGRPPGTPEFTQELFSDMAFNALNKAAADYASAGLTSYTLPASVPDCKRECWAIEIAKNNRITVLQRFEKEDSGGGNFGGGFGGSTVTILPKLPTVSVNIIPQNYGGSSTIIPQNSGGSTTYIPQNYGGSSTIIPNSGGSSIIDRSTKNDTSTIIPNSGGSSTIITKRIDETTSHEYKPPDTITPDIPVSVTNCPPGTHWDNTIHSCVPDYVPPPYVPPKVTECPYGTHWDDVIHSCVPDYTPPPTTYVPPAPYVPPPSIPVTQCPPGMHWDDTVHSCVPDYVPPPVTMVPPPSPDVPNIPATITQCPPGTHWDNTVRSCVPDTPYPVPSPGPSPGPLRPGSPGDGQDCGCGKQEDDDDCDEGLGSLVRGTSRREWY